MSSREIALELTLKAIECNHVIDSVPNENTKGKELNSSFNQNTATEIANFYNTILKIIDIPTD